MLVSWREKCWLALLSRNRSYRKSILIPAGLHVGRAGSVVSSSDARDNTHVSIHT